MTLNTQYINSSDNKLIQKQLQHKKILPIYTQEIKTPKINKKEKKVKIATFKLKLKQKNKR
jgi:hypothetical protein